MNNEIKRTCENCIFYSHTGCKANILCIRGSNFLAADDPTITIVKIPNGGAENG